MSDDLVCEWCKEPITWADATIEMTAGRWHKECAMRSVVGSVGHLERRCSCFVKDGKAAHDPPGMTKREAARAAALLFARLGDTEYPECSPYKLG